MKLLLRLCRKLPSAVFITSERGPTTSPKVAAKKSSEFDPKAFLSAIDGGRKIATFSKEQAIFVQGDWSNAVFYIQKGKVNLAVALTVPRAQSQVRILIGRSRKLFRNSASIRIAGCAV